jgi:hypothetical protein
MHAFRHCCAIHDVYDISRPSLRDTTFIFGFVSVTVALYMWAILSYFVFKYNGSRPGVA